MSFQDFSQFLALCFTERNHLGNFCRGPYDATEQEVMSFKDFFSIFSSGAIYIDKAELFGLFW